MPKNHAFAALKRHTLIGVLSRGPRACEPAPAIGCPPAEAFPEGAKSGAAVFRILERPPRWPSLWCGLQPIVDLHNCGASIGQCTVVLDRPASLPRRAVRKEVRHDADHPYCRALAHVDVCDE